MFQISLTSFTFDSKNSLSRLSVRVLDVYIVLHLSRLTPSQAKLAQHSIQYDLYCIVFTAFW